MKSLASLTNDDLRSYPIWRYEGRNDLDALVVPASNFDRADEVAYIVRTKFAFRDGSVHWGFCSPTDDSGLDYIQPVIVTSHGHVPIWSDIPVSQVDQVSRAAALERLPEDVFPLRYECSVPCGGRVHAGTLTGFGQP